MNSWTAVVSHLLQHSQLATEFLDTLVKSFVILIVAGGVCLCWRRSAASARHLVWFLAVAGLLCLPGLSRLLPAWQRPLWAVGMHAGSANELTLTLEFVPAKPSTASLHQTPAPSPAAAIHAPGPAQAAGGQRLATHFHTRWAASVLAVWFSGAVIILLSVAVGRLRLRALRRAAQSLSNGDWLAVLRLLCDELRIGRPVTLLQSADDVMPITWGWWQPVILLPAEADQWSLERRRVVLLHELAHVKRWDCLTQMIARLACAAYWFNPLVWVAARRMCIERERACDDLVLNGGCKASEYAAHLVEIARTFRRVPQVAAIAMARSRGLERRVVAILDDHRNRHRVAKTTAALMALAVAGAGLSLGGAVETIPAWSFERSEVAEQWKRFVAEKQTQATAALQTERKEMLPEFSAMFAAAAKGDWTSINKIWSDLRERAPQYEGKGPKDDRLHGTAWQTMLEIWGAFGHIATAEKETVAFGRDAISSIPPGSIYFGGTDPGRCVITALQKSQVNADPFFTLTQNALADGSYLQYLRDMYGARIYIPTDEDSKRCFDEYLADAQRRLKEKQLKPGEDITEVDGKVQVSGQVAVMTINAQLAKLIFDRHPDREFYLEESFPLDWMYPHLSPNGPILKLNRQPLAELPAEVLEKDREYWTLALEPLVGGWLQYDTPVQTVAVFAGKVQLPPLKGDPRDPQEDSAQKWASKLRSSIAGVYAWRTDHAADEADRRSMIREADFAFRQAFAVCPYSPEAVFRYVNFLIAQKRISDAILVAQTAAHVDRQNPQVRELVQSLKKTQEAH